MSTPKLDWPAQRQEQETAALLVDTGATFTALPKEHLLNIGVQRVPAKTRLELGRNVDADIYAVVMSIEDRQGATLAVTFPGAKSVRGLRSLEDLGLRVDRVTGRLGPTHPSGVAFYY